MVQIAIRATPDGLQISAPGLRRTLAGLSRAQAEVASLTLGPKTGVVLVRVRQDTERHALLLGGRRGKVRVLWEGRLDPHGDPGERIADTLELERSDDRVRIAVARTDESVIQCGRPRALLDHRVLDPKSLTWVAAPPKLPKDDAPALVVTPDSPAVGPPVLGALRFVAASSRIGEDTRLSPAPPLELGDADPSTFWAPAMKKVRGAFVTAHWDSSQWPIRAIAVTPVPTLHSKDLRRTHPKSAWLVTEAGSYRFGLPADATPGQRFWLVPPRPLPARCLSLVLDAPHVPGVAVALAGLDVYTDLDYGGGIRALVEALSGPTGAAQEAVRWLKELGGRGLPALEAGWQRLTPVGRRRAVRVLGAAAEHAPARRLLLSASLSAEAKVRDAAFQALSERVVLTHEQLGELASQTGAEGDRAALALARGAPVRAVSALLRAIALPGGSERPGLRRALHISFKRGGAAAANPLRSWLPSAPAAAMASVALAVTTIPGARSLATDVLLAAIAKARDFPALWRLANAARPLPSDPMVDSWLTQLATDGRWMLRAAALEALAQRGADTARQAALQALRDTYPRVRIAAVRVLAAATDVNFNTLDTLARTDPWPLVRANALEALALHPQGTRLLRAGVADRTSMVRAAALQALTKRRDVAAWSLVRARLLDANEWPTVTAQAIAYVAELCLTDAQDALENVVERGLRAGAWVHDVRQATTALHAAARIGGERARQLLQTAAAATAPAPLQAAAAQARLHAKACTPVAPTEH